MLLVFSSRLCHVIMQVAREAHFSGQSFLDLTNHLTDVPSLRNNFYASFSFRTGQKEGLMFYHSDQVGPASCFLFAQSLLSVPLCLKRVCAYRSDCVRCF